MSNKFKQIKKVLALVLCIGALPFVNCESAYARDNGEWRIANGEWFDDYAMPVGFTYGAQANLNANYLWRGLCAGGMNLQASANVGYGGLYADVWFNIGTTDWAFSRFLPEVDITLGFNRWGLNLGVVYIHSFNCGFFDFTNYPDKGNHLEVDARYTISKKFPLSFLWATRVAAADSYLNDAGDTIRAWSSYAEISYTQALPYGMSLYGAVGITPWRSLYTGFERNFAVQNIELRLRKDWEVTNRCGMMIQGQLTINPSALAADKTTARWYLTEPWRQGINANVTFGVYLIR